VLLPSVASQAILLDTMEFWGRHEASKRAQMQTNQFNPNDRELRKGEERY
jgi:hypothetical protein